jgi:hypothetical protein
MKKFVIFFIIINSFAATAQTNLEILNDKIRPIAFQVEKTLSTTLKDRIAEHYPKDKISVDVKLSLNPARLASRIGIPLQKSKFSLPGLDESKDITDTKLLNFHPTLSDIVSVVTLMEVSIITPEKIDEASTAQIKKLIDSEISTLKIRQINYKFLIANQNNKSNIDKTLTQETSSIDQSSEKSSSLLPMVIGVSALTIALILSYFFFQGIKKLEGLLKDLNQGLASFASGNLGTGANQGLPPVQKIEISNSGNSSSGEDEEEINQRLEKLLTKNPEIITPYFDHILDIQDFAKMLVILSALNTADRASWSDKMPESFRRGYNHYISCLVAGPEMERILFLMSKEMHGDLKLLSHDPLYLLNKSIKIKIEKVKREFLVNVFEKCNESEFSHLIKIIDPVFTASTLAQHPTLIDKYSKISSDNLSASSLKILSHKLNAFAVATSRNVIYPLASFLSPEIEAEFNRKTGAENTSWELLSEKQLFQLEKYAKGLGISQLSALLAIIPDGLKTQILSRLPDIKSQQLQRHGIKLTDESFRLKSEFITYAFSETIQ